jgi:hypothetical protein
LRDHLSLGSFQTWNILHSNVLGGGTIGTPDENAVRGDSTLYSNNMYIPPVFSDAATGDILWHGGFTDTDAKKKVLCNSQVLHGDHEEGVQRRQIIEGTIFAGYTKACSKQAIYVVHFNDNHPFVHVPAADCCLECDPGISKNRSAGESSRRRAQHGISFHSGGTVAAEGGHTELLGAQTPGPDNPTPTIAQDQSHWKKRVIQDYVEPAKN